MPTTDPILRYDEERPSIPDLPLDDGAPGMPSGGGGDGQPKAWVVSGRLQVCETEIDGGLHDRDLTGRVPLRSRARPGQIGDADYGIVRFIDRACDIHRLGDDVRQMLERSIDPLATDEPRDALANAAA